MVARNRSGDRCVDFVIKNLKALHLNIFDLLYHPGVEVAGGDMRSLSGLFELLGIAEHGLTWLVGGGVGVLFICFVLTIKKLRVVIDIDRG